jgi:hypothetical protein
VLFQPVPEPKAVKNRMHLAVQQLGIVLPEPLPVLGTYRLAKRQAVAASGTIMHRGNRSHSTGLL